MLGTRAAASAPSAAGHSFRNGHRHPDLQPTQLHARSQSAASAPYRAFVQAAQVYPGDNVKQSGPVTQSAQRKAVHGAFRQHEDGVVTGRHPSGAHPGSITPSDPAGGSWSHPCTPSQPLTAASQTAAALAQPASSPADRHLSQGVRTSAHGTLSSVLCKTTTVSKVVTRWTGAAWLSPARVLASMLDRPYDVTQPSCGRLQFVRNNSRKASVSPAPRARSRCKLHHCYVVCRRATSIDMRLPLQSVMASSKSLRSGRVEDRGSTTDSR